MRVTSALNVPMLCPHNLLILATPLSDSLTTLEKTPKLGDKIWKQKASVWS